MPELLVVGFKDNLHRAVGVLDELRVLDDTWILDLAEAVALHREHNGNITMDQSYQPTGRHAEDWSGELGLMIGASLSCPILRNGSEAVAEGVVAAAGLARVEPAGVDARWWRQRLDVSETFLDGVSQIMLAGDSAIYAVIEAQDPIEAIHRFQRYGGLVLSESLDRSQQAKWKRLIKG